MKKLTNLLIAFLCIIPFYGNAQTPNTPSKAGVKILVLCTGNSCRSQMTYGFLESFDSSMIVRSGGTNPSSQVKPLAVQVMKEEGIDISDHTPHNVNEYINEDWDYVITVCDNAKKTCPAFVGNVKHLIHIGFEDPSEATGSDEFILSEYRRVRDQIKERFYKFYTEEIEL